MEDKKTTKVTLVQENSVADFEAQVGQLLDKGWQLHGTLQVTPMQTTISKGHSGMTIENVQRLSYTIALTI